MVYDSSMKCPYCKKHIDEELLKKAIASINGKKSKRTLTPEQAKAMVAKGGIGLAQHLFEALSKGVNDAN